MTVRIGVVGGGTFGFNHLAAFNQRAAEGRAELVALADLNEKLLAEREAYFGVKGYTDYRDMLDEEELDAVSIATPDHLHREVALAALVAGKHVLVEKPLDVTEEGCREIEAAAHKHGRLLQVDFHKRYDADHRHLAERIHSGDLGEILYGYVHMEDRIEVPSRWFPGWAAESSPAWFLGIHFYDLVRWMIRDEAIRVSATGWKQKLTSMGIETYDAIQSKVEFSRGASITFDTAWILPDGFEAVVNQGVRLVGTEGCYSVDSQDRGTESCLTGEGMRTYNNHFIMKTKSKSGGDRYTGYGIESILDFADNLEFLAKGGSLDELEGRYPCGEDGLAATRIAVAVHRSAAENRAIDLHQEREIRR